MSGTGQTRYFGGDIHRRGEGAFCVLALAIPTESEAPDVQQKACLIIDDHDASRRVLGRLLRGENYEVTDYGCCESADHQVNACNIDIALLDVRLPGRWGPDFARELRGLSSRVMIVFLTGEELLGPLRLAVADCFVIRKPVDPHQLLKLLHRFD